MMILISGTLKQPCSSLQYVQLLYSMIAVSPEWGGVEFTIKTI